MAKNQPAKKGKGPQLEHQPEDQLMVPNSRAGTAQPEEPEAGPSQPRRPRVVIDDDLNPDNEDESSADEPIPTEQDIDRLLAKARKENERLKAKAELERLQTENDQLKLGGRPLTFSMRPAPEPQASFISKLPIEKLPDYYGKHIREHADWTESAENTFSLFRNMFADDETKIRYAAQYLKQQPKKAWFTHAKTLRPENATWKYFSNFLLDMIEDPTNRSLTVALDYHKAKQSGNQTAHSFHAYLTSLESQLPEVSEQVLAMNFLVRLRPNLIEAIAEQASLPQTRENMVGLAVRLENARKHRLSSATDQKPQRNNKRARDKSPGDKDPKGDNQHGPRNKGAGSQQSNRWSRDKQNQKFNKPSNANDSKSENKDKGKEGQNNNSGSSKNS